MTIFLTFNPEAPLLPDLALNTYYLLFPNYSYFCLKSSYFLANSSSFTFYSLNDVDFTVLFIALADI